MTVLVRPRTDRVIGEGRLTRPGTDRAMEKER
ncbi:hypothetical protein FHS43_001056 [Streptosporangium becharense]|uniref:Uncharacterized protein n=1 Tax=Streptosporangium becharense TaxID=1816182 RepID=A0A7W9MFX0_9ACTN|nr:hypothetical protein [Streptosporangium becharense]MBB5819235.1 hypothetical protein [Streptosporangium becharense]